MLGAVALLGLSFVVSRWSDFGLWFAGFLPSIIHVCVFTACFVLVGALKARDWSGVGLLVVYGACAAACFAYVPETNYVAGAMAHEQYTVDFYDLNTSLSQLFFERPLANLDELFASDQGLMIARFIAFCYTYHYLNWFSKTSVIRWHDVPRGRLLACVALWLGSLALYSFHFGLGVLALAYLSQLHVYLEFPLNHRSFLTIGSELGGLAGGRRRARS